MVEVNKADNQATKTKRDAFIERMKGRHPDSKYEDDEQLFGDVNGDYDDYENQIGTYKKNEEGISNLLTADPRSASFISNWAKGEDPAVQLIRTFGQTDLMDAINDPKKQEAIAAANKEFLDRVAKEKELEDMYQQNLDASLQNIQAYQQQSGLSDDEVDMGIKQLEQIASDAIVGKIAPETLELILKGQKHDADVQQAATDGEVKGKNTKIDLSLKKREKSGMPATLNSGNGQQPTKRIAPSGRKSIWDVGK